jgi:hypothetical protein
MRNPDPANRRLTSLAWAAILGHTETFEFLLNAGHDDEEHSQVCLPPKSYAIAACNRLSFFANTGL